MKKQQIIIFILVGIMLFSAVATGLLLLTAQSNDSGDDASANNTTQEDTVDQQPTNPGTPMGEWPVTADDITKLETQDLRNGDGQVAKVGDNITVHYRLSLADGTPVPGNDTFGGDPITFGLVPGGLIEGWIEGIPGMAVNGYRRLLVPSEKAYGDQERGGIPANSDLIFDVELIAID